MTENEKLGEKIRKIVELLVESLERAGIKYFQSNPTAEFTHRGDNIMVSLIDENNPNVICKMNQDLHVGKKYFFINKKTLLDPNYNILYTVHPLFKKIVEELKEDSSFNTNLERVSALIKNKHYSVSLVFIVSALESVFSDIFYRYNYLWFLIEIINSQNYADDGLIIQYGSKFNDHDREYSILLEKEINGEKWVLTSKYLPLINKWLNLKVWEYIFNTCKKFGVYEDYLLKLQGNKLREIGRFEILKITLRKRRSSNRGINFQSFSDKGITKAFNRFLDINIDEMNKEKEILEEVISKRHQIIHGNLKDAEIDLEEVEQARDALKRIVDFLHSKINIRENTYLAAGTFFE